MGSRGKRDQRRRFLQGLAAAVSIAATGRPETAGAARRTALPSRESLDLDTHWEGLNLGYWRNEKGILRRAVRARGDRARSTGFPFHYESQTNPEGVMPVDYDPSLPLGIIWNRNWKLEPPYSLSLRATVLALTSIQRAEDDPNWRMYQPGYGLLGLSIGGATQFESFWPSVGASVFFAVRENGEYGLMRHVQQEPQAVAAGAVGRISPLAEGDRIELQLDVEQKEVSARLKVNGKAAPTIRWSADREWSSGYYGLAARGLLDVAVEEVALDAERNQALHAPLNDCHVCYPLGDTLRRLDDGWQVRFVALFRSSGERIEVRIADSPTPAGGWSGVPVAGAADVVSNDFRRNSAIVDARLPGNPATETLYYTVWKDGVDVTGDPRIGTDSTGPGTGIVGDVPASGSYVGRLPQLSAPYRIAGLSCHAISTASRADLPDAEPGRCGRNIVAGGGRGCNIHQAFYVHDQPCEGAFRHLEDFNFQIMLWEDDVWYLELLLYPPSTEDAYKIITATIAGPTTRWQMMRHWNVLNPGDHDHGMDDVKGPEQIAIRNRDDLGQDPDYMVRNFQIVSHLMTGKENPNGKDNPKRWRRWKMPNRDFTLLVMDSRLWRTSQDPAIWDDEGWGHDKELYSRQDPTRALLGEEQYAWLVQMLRTDASPLICLTGINGLHTIWGGHDGQGWLTEIIDRDRVSADYAGWVRAGADRVLSAISGRTGVVSVYGDVHSGSIVRNTELRVFECSFGPIGRWGGRSLIDGFGRRMQDADGRPVECVALYHHEYKDPDLNAQESIRYWNILDAAFDPRPADAEFRLRIRNITDSADAESRGGGDAFATASQTGRPATARLPELTTLPNADVQFLTLAGSPICGTRSRGDGSIGLAGLIGPYAEDKVIVLANDGVKTRSEIVELRAPDRPGQS